MLQGEGSCLRGERFMFEGGEVRFMLEGGGEVHV